MPELDTLYAIPNGSAHHIVTAVRLKQTGVRAGVPDICLPVARGGYNSLYVEMKRTKGGVVSAIQKAWITALEEQGNKVVVARGFDEARRKILNYLEGEKK